MEDPFGLEDADEVLIEDFPDDGWEGEVGGAGEEAEEDLPGGQPGNLLAEGHDVEADIDGLGDGAAAGLPRSVHQINHEAWVGVLGGQRRGLVSLQNDLISQEPSSALLWMHQVGNLAAILMNYHQLGYYLLHCYKYKL